MEHNARLKCFAILKTRLLRPGLHLNARRTTWTCDSDWPHITPFSYELAVFTDDNEDELQVVGRAEGYRIVQDWSVDDDEQIWDEADALDGNAVGYVDSLIRELRACAEVFGMHANVISAQHITLLSRVEAVADAEPAELLQATAASLAMMDAPVFMLVDPWPAGDAASSAAKLKARGHIIKLLELGFQRMVSSRFLWAWNRQMDEVLMDDYSYEKLVAAKNIGSLDDVLKSRLSNGLYGELPDDIAAMLGLPDPNELMDE